MTTKDNIDELKKNIGQRLKEFRQSIQMNLNELADELNMAPSLLCSIEQGTTFPGISPMYYLRDHYHLSLNWLITGNEEMIIKPGAGKKPGDLPRIGSDIEKNDPMYKDYQELNLLLKMPEIEQIIFHKLSEIKEFFKDDIQLFLKKEKYKEKKE